MHFDAGQQLTNAEWLADEIDGTEFQAANDVFLGGERGHHDHRHVLAIIDPALQNLDPEQTRHHLVEQDQVEICGETNLECVNTVVDGCNLCSDALETAGDEQRNDAVVFGNQDMGSIHKTGL